MGCLMYHHRHRRAFSLVELSIVLVILGLLVGGILSGQSLIRASQLRALTRQYQGYYTAVQTFRDKYFALPGDMTNATQFWGLRAAGAACMGSASSDTKTCDGNGDGQIDIAPGSSVEYTRFWQHLANAGLIEGQYNGLNYPASKLGGTTRFAGQWSGTLTGNTINFDGDYGNVLYTTDMLIPSELWNIDTKMDDGIPSTGKVVVLATTGPNWLADCTTAAAGVTSNLNVTYLLSGTANTCEIMFRKQY